MLFFYTGLFECFDLFVDQIQEEIAMVGFLLDDKFRELVNPQNLLAYFEL